MEIAEKLHGELIAFLESINTPEEKIARFVQH